jgi:hypothetical protein
MGDILRDQAENAIWKAVDAAIDADMTVREFLVGARTCWRDIQKRHQKMDDDEFQKAISNLARKG